MGILDNHWDKYVVEIATGCFIWTGYCTGSRGKRPNVRVGGRGGKNMYVARIVCEEVNGPPPFPNAEAAHKPFCNNSLCVNGEHTYWATRSQNEMDKSPETRARVSAIGVASVERDEVTGQFA